MSGLIQPGGNKSSTSVTDAVWPRAIAAPDSAFAPQGGELSDLKEMLGIVRRRRWLVALCALGGAGLATYLAYKAKPVYLASASVRIADARQSLAGGIADVPRDNYGGSFGVDPVLSQIQVLKSREVATDAIHRQPLGLVLYPDGIPASDLRDVRVDSESVGTYMLADFRADGFTLQEGKREISGRYGEPVSLAGVTFTVVGRPTKRSASIGILAPTNAVGMLLDGVDARPRKSTDVVDVTYRANDPYIAQQVANAIVSSYKAVNANNSQQQSRRRREFIQEQLKQTDSLFADATQSLSSFRSASQVYGSDARVSAEQTGLLTLDVTREQLAADKSTLQSLLSNLEDVSKGKGNEKLDALFASPGIAGNPVVSALFGQLVQLRVRRDSLTTGGWASAKTNPDVMKLDTLIASTNHELLAAVRSNLQADDARLASLDGLRTRNASNLQRLPAVQAVEARLMQRVETARKMADQLREEYQKARISEAVEVGQVEIVDYAVLPDMPIGRGALFKILAGLIIGLMLGGGAAVLVERLNTTIRKRDDVESMLHVPGLAVIPQIVTSSKLGLSSLGNRLKLPGMTTRRDRSGNDTLVTVTDFGSIGAEAYRTLRTNLIFSQAIQTLRTIVITSPSPKDGKSTTAANLAVTFAQQGMRVLIIDCDMRKARLHNMFQVPREPGFSQLLVKQSTVAEVVKPTAIENLWVIPAGLLPANPSELLGSAVARTTIELLAADYDIVILDTPPVHVAADALILGSMANGVLVVLRAGYSERAAAQEALQRLHNVGAHVVGAVLNDPDHKVPEYGSYYYYYDYHDEKVEA